MALLINCMSDESSGLTYWDAKIDSGTARGIVGIVGVGGSRARDVYDAGNLVFFQYFTQLSLVLDGDKDFFDRKVWLIVDVGSHLRS